MCVRRDFLPYGCKYCVYMCQLFSLYVTDVCYHILQVLPDGFLLFYYSVLLPLYHQAQLSFRRCALKSILSRYSLAYIFSPHTGLFRIILHLNKINIKNIKWQNTFVFFTIIFIIIYINSLKQITKLFLLSTFNTQHKAFPNFFAFFCQ